MTSVIPELQSLAPSAIIELFELHTNLELHGSSEIYRFHSGASRRQSNGDIVWNGNRYQRFPIEATGFEYNGTQLPRPKLRVANLFSIITSVLINVNSATPGNDLIGAKVVRIRTCARYLDAVNFEGNQNPYGSPDPTAEAPREIYNVDRKVSENRDFIEFELAATIDLVNVKLPSRQCISSVCQWKYRGPECGYTGTAVFDENDNPSNLVPAANFSAGPSTLGVGESLYANQFLVSPNGWYKVIMQTDGNLVVYSKALKPVWNTLTYGKGQSRFIYQADGNLVIYDALGRATWNSNTQNQARIASLNFTQYIPDTYSRGDKDEFTWVPAPNFDAQASSVSSSGSGFALYPGESLTSANLWYRLLMQRDGSLVVYNKANFPVWSTQTGGQPSYAWFQPDGNLVLYRYSDGAAIWSSNTGMPPVSIGPASNFPTGTGTLLPGSDSASRLSAGQDLYTSNGWYKLSMAVNGNLAIFNKGNKAIWNSGTTGSGATYAQFQADGNLVLYDNAGGIKWRSNTGSYPSNTAKRLVLQPDGNLVIYGIGGATSTARVPAPNFPTGTGRILVGDGPSSQLLKEQVLYSQNGWYRLKMQSDGNLVITDKAGSVTWNSGTYGTAAHFAAFQPDGNLVLYAADGSTAIWWTNHGQYPQNTGYVWLLDDSGEFVLFDRNNLPVWRSWTGRTPEPTVVVTSQSADTPLWSTVSGRSGEPSIEGYPVSTLTMGNFGTLAISTGGSDRWTNGYSNNSEPGVKQETGDNRAHAFLWEVFGSAQSQAGQTKTVSKTFDFGPRSLTVSFVGVANVNLPAGHYSGQNKSWSLTSDTFLSSIGRWYLDEFVDAIIETAEDNPFRNHPAGAMTGVGRQYRILGVLSSAGQLRLQNDGNFVLYDVGNNPVWNSEYYTAIEPMMPGDGGDFEDVCGKRLSSCRARFGDLVDLPFGSFPGVGQYFA